jgi:hypothetical protein
MTLHALPFFFLGAGAGFALLSNEAIRRPTGQTSFNRLAVMGILATMMVLALLHFIDPPWSWRFSKPEVSCADNLGQIERILNAGGPARIALIKALTPPSSSREASDSLLPTCPGGGNYRLGANDLKPLCSLDGREHWLREPPKRVRVSEGEQAVFSVVCGAGLMAAFLIAIAAFKAPRWPRRLALVSESILVLLVVFLAVPLFVNARANSSRSSCPLNLRLIQDAKRDWAARYHKSGDATPTDADIYGNSPHRIVRFCPTYGILNLNGIYSLNKVDEKPTCSLDIPGHRLECEPVLEPIPFLTSFVIPLSLGLAPFVLVLLAVRSRHSKIDTNQHSPTDGTP